ncbi:hypothetical protein LTR92_002751 [Exophiala xenobiotica]|nr:hypothetical protein LTR92_002751 [Exophiala xenobiotica]KAK5433686.1 hypothetical protein LTR18_010636 [Exophiala xenobiotica]
MGHAVDNLQLGADPPRLQILMKTFKCSLPEPRVDYILDVQRTDNKLHSLNTAEGIEICNPRRFPDKGFHILCAARPFQGIVEPSHHAWCPDTYGHQSVGMQIKKTSTRIAHRPKPDQQDLSGLDSWPPLAYLAQHVDENVIVPDAAVAEPLVIMRVVGVVDSSWEHRGENGGTNPVHQFDQAVSTALGMAFITNER